MSAALTAFDLHLIAEGKHYRAYEKLGAHVCRRNGERGVCFRVWAPNAERVSVIGDFNGWEPHALDMQLHSEAGIWECFTPQAQAGSLYKYRVESRYFGCTADKADPYGFAAEIRPQTASKVWDIGRYGWGDGEWMEQRRSRNLHASPMSIYEVHLGSWTRVPEENGRWLTYREMAEKAHALPPRDGLHPCGIDAHYGTSLRWFVGISNRRLFRAYRQIRQS